jgi:photosystem II stability/assembly factor-like uncharacterized protein
MKQLKKNAPKWCNAGRKLQQFFRLFLCISIFVLFLGLNTLTQAQSVANILQPTDTTYYQICARMEAYFAANPTDTAEDGLSAKFGRWQRFWRNRVDGNGGFETYAKAIGELAKNGINDFCASTLDDDKNWLNLGPFNSDNITIHDQGRVESISVNPDAPLDILIGGDGGGVWRTIDGGVNWVNTTDDEGYFSIAGINSIVRHPTNPEWVYAATGIGGSGYHMSYDNRNPSYGIGVLFSTDGGTTWSQSIIPDIATDATQTIFKSITKMVIHNAEPALYIAVEKRLLKGTFNADGSLSWSNLISLGDADEGIVDLEVETNGTIWLCNRNTLFRYANGALTLPNIDPIPVCNGTLDVSGMSIALNLDNELVLMRLTIYKETIGTTIVKHYCSRLDFLNTYDESASPPATWSQKELPGSQFIKTTTLNIGAHDNQLIFAENGSRQVIKSTDGGTTFSVINEGKTHVDVRALFTFINSDVEELYMGDDGGIAKASAANG